MLNVHLDRAAQIELFKGCVMIDWRHFKLPHGHIADRTDIYRPVWVAYCHNLRESG